jgi:hypothetical protein
MVGVLVRAIWLDVTNFTASIAGDVRARVAATHGEISLSMMGKSIRVFCISALASSRPITIVE